VRGGGRSFTAKDAKDAKEQKRFTAKDAKDAKGRIITGKIGRRVF
jgi:hypothetical protein